MKTYLVGGAVRDKLLGIKPSEHDWVVVGASPEEMLRLGYRQVGKDFPVFLHPETKDEYALARTERKTAPGYTGFIVHATPDVSLEEDLKRRDLTINAIAEDENGKLIDPFHGQEDLQNGLLRHISPAFAEDPVRILRVARFAARFASLGFTVVPETMELMRSMVASGEVDAALNEEYLPWPELLREGQATSLKVTRLMTAVIRDWDLENALGALTHLGFAVDHFPSAGGFLNRSNVTLMIGLPSGREDAAVKALKRATSGHVVFPENAGAGTPIPLPAGTPVRVGGATIFTFELDSYEEF